MIFVGPMSHNSGMKFSEQAILDRISGEGLTVREAQLPDEYWGYYDKERRLIVLQQGMTGSQRIATLLHEYAHHLRGDAGHQPQAVEDRIDEEVARMLVSAEDYRFWERQFGGSVAGIAYGLEVPRFIVEAYQRTLGKVT